MEEQQSPMTVWCGGRNADQDVSIRLVPNGINQHQVTDLRSREPLAVLKVHSNRLKKHSKYFQASFSKRWTQPDANPSQSSMEFSLEIHGLRVASYKDCFSRMYTPFRKNFKGVKSSLGLLRVTSQIEFQTLVKSICRYLSTILWSDVDELRIRQFSSSPDFPRSQAQDLVARLQMGERGNEDHRRKLLSHQIAHNIHIALRQHRRGPTCRESFLRAQSFFEDLFRSIRQSETDSAFENDVVKVVSKEVKDMLERFHEDCRKHASFSHDLGGETTVSFKIEDVHDFKGKLKALCWALELLLKAQVAEEVIECLLHLELFFAIIVGAEAMDSRKPASKNIGGQFYKLVVFIFREVVAGRLLLGIPDRVLLIQSWQWIDCILDLDTQNDILVTCGFGQALEGVFLTLPLEQQMEALQLNSFFSHTFICRSSLVTLLKRNWPAEEDALLQADLEVDGVVSDSTET